MSVETHLSQIIKKVIKNKFRLQRKLDRICPVKTESTERWIVMINVFDSINDTIQCRIIAYHELRTNMYGADFQEY
jgi:hypothetical protein